MSRPARRSNPCIDVVIPDEPPPMSRVFLDADLAQMVRKCARAERQMVSDFVRTVLMSWLARERPKWVVVEEKPPKEGEEAAPETKA